MTSSDLVPAPRANGTIRQALAFGVVVLVAGLAGCNRGKEQAKPAKPDSEAPRVVYLDDLSKQLPTEPAAQPKESPKAPEPEKPKPAVVGKEMDTSRPATKEIDRTRPASPSLIPYEAVASRRQLQEIKTVQIKGKHRVLQDGRGTEDFTMTWQGVERTKVDQQGHRLRGLGGLGRGGRLTLPGGHSSTIVLIGEQGWVAFGANKRRLEGDGLAFYQNFHYGTILSNLVALAEEGFTAVPAGEATVAGKKCFALVVKRPGKPDLKMFFDKDTKLVVKTEFRGRFLIAPTLVFDRSETFVEFYFRDYKEVDGIKHWHVREQWRNGRKFSELTLSEVRLLKRRDDSLFHFPAFDAEVKKALAAKD
jgi:hypothetical protein